MNDSISKIIMFNEIWPNEVESQFNEFHDNLPYPFVQYSRIEQVRMVPYWIVLREHMLAILCASILFYKGVKSEYELDGDWILNHTPDDAYDELIGIHALNSTLEALTEKLLSVHFLSSEKIEDFEFNLEDSLEQFIKNNFGYQIIDDGKLRDYNDDILYYFSDTKNIVIPFLLNYNADADIVNDIIAINTPSVSNYNVLTIPVEQGALVLLFPVPSYYCDINEIMDQAVDYTAFSQLMYEHTAMMEGQ